MQQGLVLLGQCQSILYTVIIIHCSIADNIEYCLQATNSHPKSWEILEKVPKTQQFNYNVPSFKDLHQLGKFKPGTSYPSLLLVKFPQTFNVNSILANQYQIQESSVTINPEEER